MSPAVQVAIQDGQGITITTASSPISIDLSWDDPDAGAARTPLGTLTQFPVNGVATFSDLTVDLVGSGYVLVATADLPSLTTVTSKPFSVVPGAPNALVFFNGEAMDVVAGIRIRPLYVYVTDVNRNPTRTSNAITLAITNDSGTSGAVLRGTLTQVAVDGVATFDDLSIDLPGVGYSLTATATGLSGATTSSFSVRSSSR
jgi:hypothetical protein